MEFCCVDDSRPKEAVGQHGGVNCLCFLLYPGICLLHVRDSEFRCRSQLPLMLPHMKEDDLGPIALNQRAACFAYNECGCS